MDIARKIAKHYFQLRVNTLYRYIKCPSIFLSMLLCTQPSNAFDLKIVKPNLIYVAGNTNDGAQGDSASTRVITMINHSNLGWWGVSIRAVTKSEEWIPIAFDGVMANGSSLEIDFSEFAGCEFVISILFENNREMEFPRNICIGDMELEILPPTELQNVD